MNGHKLSNKTYPIHVYPGASLIITDSKGSVEICSIEQSVAITNLGNLTINGGYIHGQEYSIQALGKKIASESDQTATSSTTIINGGTLYGIVTNRTEVNNTVIVNGGTFKTPSYFASGHSEYFINGGTFTGLENYNFCIQLKAGTLTINGGTFEFNKDSSNNKYCMGNADDGPDELIGAITVSKSIIADDRFAYVGDAELTINGGTFTNNRGDAIAAGDYATLIGAGKVIVNIKKGEVNGGLSVFNQAGENRKAVFRITGGKFSNDPTDPENKDITIADDTAHATMTKDGKDVYVLGDQIDDEMKKASNGTAFTITKGDLTAGSIPSGVTVINKGTGTVCINGTRVVNGQTLTTSKSTSVEPSKITPEIKNAIYRVYNSRSGEHFFTSDYTEFKTLVHIGWSDEGISWMNSTGNNAVAIYRVYNPNSELHHYTLDMHEKNVLVHLGWKDEGIAWYSSTNPAHAAVYRLYNPNDGHHHYTSNLNEKNILVRLGWNDEGIGYRTTKVPAYR